MRIDPKAPANSPQHPANWRKPVFLAPTQTAPEQTAPEPTVAPPARPKAAAKKPAKKTRNLADALAKLGDE